ncbi:protocadherin Fat 4-like [Anomaloglossus baeobatrachus]|uniref:protocadherin Fat 4-like n=1 Tax=Anomaloglossus baeobatrachus TaxID=238106 RepID=UPI003F4F4E29
MMNDVIHKLISTFQYFLFVDYRYINISEDFTYVSGHIHYSINEELRKGSIVGNLAKDLELNVKDLSRRKLRIVSKISEKYFNINLDNGNLYIADRIDRETLCRAAADCVLTFDAVVENPLNILNVKIDIQDINDNPPIFHHDILTLEMSEYTSPGAKFSLQNAEDLDVGVNSMISYRLSENQYFALGEKVSTDGSVFPELILKKSLDRETQNKHELILTASDGGNPVQTGTALINIIITDINDNVPVFTQDVYKVSVRENIPMNSTILQVSASDEDEGVNAQITYSIRTTANIIHETFAINSNNGEIKIKGILDYELNTFYDISVQAKDGGGLAAHAKVLIEITDENDNAPEISITSSSDLIPEDSPPGTMVALIQVHDPDSGENGEVQCIITGDLPFALISSTGNFYKIVTKNSLDREKISSYNITIQASDKGSPEMTSIKVIRLEVSDVNDNAPVFEKVTYTTFIIENNLPGASIFSIQARDLDREDNAKITYSIMTRNDEEEPLSSYISLNPVTGVIYAQRSFDYEKNKEFYILIIARDNGSPSLNSSTTLRICIVDQNDNSPVILYPSPEVDSSTFEMVPWTSEQGSLVSKVVAVDADSGHNAWLSYFLQSSEPSLFTIDQHTGEIRTSRGFHEKDIMKHGIVVLVKDNGIPSRSASVTLTMVIADHFHQVLPELSSQSNKEESQSNLQFYLVIALALISFFFILTVIIAVVSKYKESKSSAFGSLSTSLYPQVDPRFISQFNPGTLPLPYSYDVCVTLDPSEREFAFVQPQHNVPVDSLIDADDSGIGSATLKNSSAVEIQVSSPYAASKFGPLRLAEVQFSSLAVGGNNLHSQVSGQIHYSINEELRKGSIVGNIAKDLELDVKDLSRRKLRIVSKISEKYFNINLNNGNLYIADRIDRETLCEAAADCVLTFDAVVENPLNVFSVKIDIQDINDNPPTFLHETLTLEMSELSSPGRTFVLQKAEDIDVGVNSLISYRLSENQYFALGEKVSTDGSVFPELILEKPLDRETQNKHELILTASDGGNPVQTGTALINIIITDVNDNSPVFTQDVYKVSVRENIPVNSTILQVSASDDDEGVNAQITYSFSNTEKSIFESFTINPDTGEIKIKGKIDYEVKKHYDISVQAKDGGGLAAHTKVLLEITDENDNAPEISITSSSDLIPEDSPPGTMVALIQVHDADSGENGEVHCIITGDLPFELISSAGNFHKIVSKSILDREKISSFNITIQASDKGSPQKTSRKVIRLDVSDVNDNAPVFEKLGYTAFIPENNSPGASIFSIQARDLDSESNAKITYSIVTKVDEEDPLSSYISMNPVTGVIYAQRSFDYEIHRDINIEIIARDNGSPSLNSSTTLRISIVDQNDNSPVILYPSPEVDSSTFEMVPWTSEQGSLVSKVVAVDADSGHNAWLSYFLQSSEPSLFTIDQHTGEIRTSRGFHEKDIMKHGIVVLVKDNGIPSRSASVTLTMVIADHFLQVLPELSSQSNKEESQSNLQFYLVIALALISFFFMLTVIIAIVSKYKESKSSSSFGSLSTSLYPQIDPRFISQFNPGTLPLPYSYDVCVTLDPSERDFAYLKPQHNVPVKSLIDADDSGIENEALKNCTPSDTQKHAYPTWQDVAWNPRPISGQIHYSINEELRKGSIVGNLAEDLELNDKDLSRRKLRIVSGISEKYFSINPNNGNLYITDRIDRETLCEAAADCVLTFDAVVENPLNVFSIKIDIQDINDNPPTFLHEILTLEMSELSSPGRKFILQKAQDLDVGVNSLISYRLSENQYFALGEKVSTDGSVFPELILEKPLDRETQNKHELILTASDGGNPVQTGTALINIIINDINDNSPVFTQDVYKVSVRENIPVNSTILQVSASDEDDGVNAQITYSFSNTEKSIFESFTINSKNGEIKIKGQIDYEVKKHYDISVEAKDGGGLAAHAKVLIEITDENDNAPEISITSSSDLIPEDSPPGTVVALIKVHDPDSGENGEVHCIITGDLPFELISSAGNFHKVVSKSSLDREKISSYNITIQASDKGSPQKTSRKVIRLDVSDVNDNAPVFEKLGYTAFIPENNSPGASIFSIQARDLDSESNAKITYSIVTKVDEEDPLTSYISMNPVTGVIYAQRSFDYEIYREINIQIIARDNGSPSLNSSTTLRISIVDQNDNSPVILYPSPEVDSSTFEMVPWTSEQGSLVSKVVAVDADSGHNAWLSYFLQSSEPSLFTIDHHTGEIRTSRGFHEKDIMKHGIVVLVKDNGIPSRSSSVTLTMVIADHFHQVLPELSSQSNKEESQSNLQFYLVIALALISFFFMLTVIIAVVSKYKESKSSSSFGSLSTSLYPQMDPRFISQFNSGTLPLPYSYDVCVTLDPSERDFAFLKPQHNVPVDSLIDADDSGIGNEALKNYTPSDTQQRTKDKNVAVPHIRLRAPLFTNEENILQIQNRLHDADSVQLQEEIHSISHWDVPVSGQIHYSINEEVRKGSIVGNLAKDLELDVKDLSRRKLRIVSGISEKYFKINLDNGNLYTADRIDRETLCRAAADCVLTFDAVVENPLNVFSIKIIIQDINDNPPTFILTTIKIEMSEYSSPGRRFLLQNAEDLDVGVSSLISYRLSENQYFALGEKVSTDGSVFPELILEKPLDRETQNKHELILTASDGGNPVQTGTALINIIITDFNDNSPVFTQDVYKVSVRENIPVNSTILQVSASDEDEGVNAQITYSISTTASDILQTFNINTKSGEIITKGQLDYEVSRLFEISVQAEDGGSLAVKVKVLVEILDINDNAPEISITSSTDLLLEDSPPGTVVALIKVHDPDSGENGEVQCIITGDLPFELVSSAGNFYKIRTKSSLDRENLSSYNITIQASDKGSPEMISRKVIRLDVSDVNDNAPVFEKIHYTTFISENNLPGASIFSIQARDLDSDDNAKITYSILTRSDEENPLSLYISMNPVTGVIYAQRSFDYEKHKEFNIQIIARDNGSPSLNSSTTLRISIVDQNDNSPVILYPSPEVESSTFEMVPWTSEQRSLVSKVVAVDADSGHNAWLSYFLQSSEPSLFTIDQHTGEIRTSRGFHEKDIMKHGIVVLVKDNGIPSRSASVTLTMVIADHFHQVLPELSSQSNKEESQSNLQFYLVIALALISFFFMLTVIIAVVSKYKESKSSSSFGSLSTSLYPQVDPRFISQFNNGTLPLPYSYDVCVTLDPSEREFAFLNSQHNVPVESLIDADDTVIGSEHLKNCPPVETQHLVGLTSSHPVQSLPRVQFRVSKGLVSGQIHYSINEELRKGSIVGNLAKELELDVKDLSRRKLRIVSDVSEKHFSINMDDGNLYTADRIDRETLCEAAADCVLTFDAVMINPLNVFSIKINIQDINDNPPTFLHETLTLEMSEYTSPGRRFLLHNAEDLDVGVNSLISYRLSETQYFSLGEKVSTDGSVFPELILEKPLDRETQNKHELILTASDGGNPVQTGTALINIIINDINDNSPVFTQDVYKVSVRENIPVNSTILQVSASDEDEGVNAQITYSISTTAKNILQTFTINPKNGEIKTKGQLDYEVSKHYDILLQAEDGGGLTAKVKVLIEITDENDNAPEISITSSSDLIPEDSPPGTMVALIKVYDRDAGENGEVQCIITGDLPFELISSTNNFYKIVSKNDLDREKVSSYNITIEASDKGSPEKTSRKLIRLGLSDVNDNAPVFEKFGYTAFVTENNSPGGSIFIIQARDLDSEDNAKITYSTMVIGNEEDPLSSYISMNPVTGVIYAQRSFDYEKHREINIQIIAIDNGSPSLNSSTTLRISIVDQNDNSPVILYPSQEVDSSIFEMVPWTSEQGSLVSKVVAVDADSGHNSWLSYFLQSSEPSLFTIDQHTGEIRTSRGFHEKDIMKHGMLVIVKDNGIPSHSASVTLTMVIADHFQQVLPELSSQSNKEESQSNLQFYLVIALALISFFFMLTVIIAIVSKYKESKSATSFGSLSTSLYPQVDPRFLSQFSNGTLPLPYSYDVCVTLDPSEREFSFLKPPHNVPVDSLIDADDSGIANESLRNFSAEDTQKTRPVDLLFEVSSSSPPSCSRFIYLGIVITTPRYPDIFLLAIR